MQKLLALVAYFSMFANATANVPDENLPRLHRSVMCAALFTEPLFSDLGRPSNIHGLPPNAAPAEKAYRVDPLVPARDIYGDLASITGDALMDDSQLIREFVGAEDIERFVKAVLGRAADLQRMVDPNWAYPPDRGVGRDNNVIQRVLRERSYEELIFLEAVDNSLSRDDRRNIAGPVIQVFPPDEVARLILFSQEPEYGGVTSEKLVEPLRTHLNGRWVGSADSPAAAIMYKITKFVHPASNDIRLKVYGQLYTRNLSTNVIFVKRQ